MTIPIKNHNNVKLIWLCNIGVEKSWCSPRDLQLPKISSVIETNILHQYEAMSIWAARCDDILILRNKIDEHYIKYIHSLGKVPPKIYIARNKNNDNHSITQLILNDHGLLGQLSQLRESERDVYLVPYGISKWEEELAQHCKIKLWGPGSDVVKKVNSKTYSCGINRKLKLQHPGSEVCRSFDGLKDSFRQLWSKKKEDEQIVLKEVMGVSGSGIHIIKKERDFKGLFKFLRNQYPADAEFEIIMEKWLPKKYEFNTQITILQDGKIRFDGIKQLFTKKNGVHLGHFFPPGIDVLPLHDKEILKNAAEKVGQELYQEGYWGVAGIDSFKTMDEVLIPVVEINARFNMASYLTNIHQIFAQDQKLLAKSYDFFIDKPLTFRDFVKNIMGQKLLFTKKTQRGILINNFSTVQSNLKDRNRRKPVKARVFAVLIDDNMDQIKGLDQKFKKRLTISGFKTSSQV